MNVFLRILLRNLAVGAGAIIATALWLAVLIFITAILAQFLPAPLAAFLFIAMVVGSVVAVIAACIELSDRRLVDFSDVNRFFGIPEEDNTKRRY